MAATDDGSVIIQLDEEVEGEHQGSDDYCFVGVGEPLPVEPGDDSTFDPQNPPSQPLAVSERFALIFVAHSTGFCVARTKEVLKSAAKEGKEKGSGGSSIKELSVADIPIGKVHILALSADSSTLAASVGGAIHFFSVSSLLNKEQNPFLSYPLNDTNFVKDMRWTKKLENYYIVLSNHGKLYYGAGQDPLKYVMDNVDAVEWSTKGNFVAVARKNILSILSSKLKQKFSMSLSFKSWIGDSDLNCTIKVDSIRWIRSDCIIIGCFQLTADGKEEDYLVQVITSKDGKITDASSNPIVLSFSDVFEGLIDDIVPSGSGPYMSLSYLDICELAIIANRKSTDQHIVLFGWSLDNEKKEAAVIDILRDNLCPKIALQGNGDDNMVLGLCVDKVSHSDKVGVKLGAEYKELSPFCILLCLSFDGKLFIFQVASITRASVPSGVSLLSDDEDNTPSVVSSEDGLSETSICFQSQAINGKDLDVKVGSEIPLKNEPMLPAVNNFLKTNPYTDETSLRETITGKVITPINSQTIKTSEQQKFPVVGLTQDTVRQESLLSGQQGTDLGLSSMKTSYVEGAGHVVRDTCKTGILELHEYGSSPDSFSGKFLTGASSPSIPITLPKGVDLGKEIPGKLGSDSSEGASSNRKLTSQITSDRGSSHLSSGSIQSNQSGNSVSSLSISHLTGGSLGASSYAKDAVGSLNTFCSSVKTAYSGGQSTSTGAGTRELLPATRSSPFSSQQNLTFGKSSRDKFHHSKENYRSPSPTRLLNSEPYLSKQFGNVEEMIKELETLLECIEGAGGFIDACTVLQKSSLLALEEGIGNLFHKCREWKLSIVPEGQTIGNWPHCVSLHSPHVLRFHMECIMDEQRAEIQSLLDNTLQVIARKIYMEGIVKQRTDEKYWDLWNRQKLSSELELKQRQILKINQELTNQVNELERHLNTLEISKFGGNYGVQMSQRTFSGGYGPSRHVQSLNSLHNIMSTQLGAAEHLSESLSKQMAMLSIEQPSVKKQNVKRELFEAVGIPYNVTSFSSPDEKRAGDGSNNKLLTSLCSDAVKGQSRRNQSSAMKGCDSEMTRRRRDSLDPSWASFEPPKTTVKRMLLNENYQKAGSGKSSLMDKQQVKFHMLEGPAVTTLEHHSITSTPTFPSEEKGSRGRLPKQASEVRFDDPSGSYRSIGLKSPATEVSPVNSFSAFSSQSASISSNDVSQNNMKGSFNLAASRSGSGATIIDKSDLLSANEFNSNQKSKIGLHQTLSISMLLPGQTLPLQNKPGETSISNDKETVLVKSTIGNVKHRPSTGESLSFDSGKVLKFPLSPALAVDPAPNMNAEVDRSDTAASKGQIGRMASTSSTSLLSTSSTSSPTVHTSLPNPTAPSSSSGFSLGRSLTSLEVSANSSQTYLLSQSLVSSSPIPSSGYSFQVPEKPVPSTIPVPSINQKTEAPKREPQPPIAKLGSPMDENFTIQPSSSKPVPAFTLNLQSSVSSMPTSEPSASLQPGNNASFNGMTTPTYAAVNSKPEQPFFTDTLSTAVPSASGSASGGKSESSDIAVIQEDDMEEEAPEEISQAELALGSLSGFGIGSAQNPTAVKPNPFGTTFGNASPIPASSSFNMTIPAGELLRPASFNFQSPQPSQPSQLTSFGGFSGGFSTGTTLQIPAGSGFGQPAQIGSGQQALGSVLGAFGQSRQLGGGLPGSSATSPSGFSGGLVGSHSTGGFAAIASSGGGFASLASAGGGFGGVGSAGGGFAAAASAGGGFAGVALSAGGGFGGGAAAPALSSAGVGFAGAASGGGFPSSGGGFGAFNSQQGSGGFSAFGGSAGATGRPQSNLFTQMRK